MSLLEKVHDVFAKGGVVMWFLLAASVVGMIFALERWLACARKKQVPPDLVPRLREVLAEGGVDAGRRLLAGGSSALSRMLDALLARSGAPRRELEAALEEEGGRVLVDLRRNLRPVGLVASVAPMLGLLGTVFGLIAAFRQAAELGMDDPANFAQGIHEALYTTAFGLVIAIPFLLGHHAIKTRMETLLRRAEDA